MTKTTLQFHLTLTVDSLTLKADHSVSILFVNVMNCGSSLQMD